MSIAKSKLKELMEKSEKMDDDVFINSLRNLLKSYRLSVDIETVVDHGLDELLSKKPEDITDQPWEILQRYLILINKWGMFVRRQINLREIYFEFIASRKYGDILRTKKAKLSDREFKSELAKEERLLHTDSELESLEIEKEIAESYFRILKGFDQDIERWHFTLQSIIRRKEREWMLANKI